MDIKDIKSLIKMLTETDVTEFELESPDSKIRIKRGSAHEISYVPSPQPMLVAPTAPQQQIAAPVSTPASAEAEAPAATAKGKAITSPIVGTLYRAPSPEAPPYVEVGQVVEKGQVLCIVEAMKLMNEIEAEYRCKILEITKENAHPVEFGETLFVVEPL